MYFCISMELREFQWYVRPTYAIMVKPTDGGNSLWKYGFHLPLFRVLVHPSRVYLLRGSVERLLKFYTANGNKIRPTKKNHIIFERACNVYRKKGIRKKIHRSKRLKTTNKNYILLAPQCSSTIRVVISVMLNDFCRKTRRR